MTARFEIGEVLLATSTGDVLRQLRVAVMPGNPALSHHLAEGQSIHLREFGGFAEREARLGHRSRWRVRSGVAAQSPPRECGGLGAPSPEYSGSSPCPHDTALRRSNALGVVATIRTEPSRAGLVGRLATTNPVEFQLIHAPEFRISRHKRTVVFLRQGGGKRIGVGNRESSLQ